MSRVLETLLQMAWAMEPGALENMTRIVIQHDIGLRLTKEEIDARILAARTNGGTQVSPRYHLVEGVAIIPMFGVLEKRAGFFSDVSGMVSTEAVQRDLAAALADPNVAAILLNIDSPGGSVSGVSDLGDAVFAARKQKPVYAFANGKMASAAYWIGSQAEKVFASRGSVVGSIGVYTVLYDYSQSAAKDGIKVQVVKAGAHKAAGIPGTEITPAQLTEVQREVNAWYDLFVTAVAVGRGLSASQANDLADGRVYLGAEALKVGLIDGVATLDETIQKMKPVARSIGSTRAALPSTSPTGAKTMTEEELRAAERKRAADLKAAFPNDLAFALDAAAGGLTVEQAKAKHHDKLAAELAAKDKAHAEELEKVKAANKPAGLKPLGDGNPAGKGNQGGSAKAQFAALVSATMKESGCDKAKAVSKVTAENAELHRQMLEEANPGKAELVGARIG